MTNYRAELQAFVDAAASFTEPALGHHKAWAEAVARARVALSVPESSANTACSITPPPKLVLQWLEDSPEDDELGISGHIATQAARWGADQELEACCEWADATGWEGAGDSLRAARRPKPLSLKKVAYDALDTYIYGNPDPKDKERTYNAIRRALEQLDD